MHGSPSRGGYLGCNSGELLFAARAQNYGGSAGGEQLRRGSSDAAARAGVRDDLPSILIGLLSVGAKTGVEGVV